MDASPPPKHSRRIQNQREDAAAKAQADLHTKTEEAAKGAPGAPTPPGPAADKPCVSDNVVADEEAAVAKDVCAACGKEESDSLKLKKCSACKSVKYCNVECQKAHRSQHKEACKKMRSKIDGNLMKEWRASAGSEAVLASIDDEQLFAVPEKETCPICFLPFQTAKNTHIYHACCGKVICNGCIWRNNKHSIHCAFCRTLIPETEQENMMLEDKRIEIGDGRAMKSRGHYYDFGLYGLPKDRQKANKYYQMAADAGDPDGHNSIAEVYYRGYGVEKDMAKATYHNMMAAIGGNADARHGLAVDEKNAGNMERAIKHWHISAGAGHDFSLQCLCQIHSEGLCSEDAVKKAFRLHQNAVDAASSSDRTAAFYARQINGDLW